MSRQQRGGGSEVARGAGYAAFLGAVLIGVAVIIGIVLLQIGDKNDNGPAGAAKPTVTTTSTSTTTTTAPGHTVTSLPPRAPSTVNLIVLNGGAASGKATAMSHTLKLKGYTQQGVATDWTGHTQTGNSVYCRAALGREGAALVVAVGNAGYHNYPHRGGPPFTTTHDCVVVVGAA